MHSSASDILLRHYVTLTHGAERLRKRALQHVSDAMRIEEGTLEDVLKLAGAILILLAIVSWAKGTVFPQIKAMFVKMMKQ